MIRWRLIVLALTVFAGTALTACQSSQDKAKQIQEQAQAAAPKPLVISKPSKDVKVTDTALLHDQNGDAVVVEVKNDSNKTLVNVPILVDIRDGKKTVYKNDTAGLDFALNHIAVLQPHETFDWVNDQVTAEGKTVKATVGDPEAKPPAGPLPKIDVSPPRAGSDFSGPKVSGEVTSDSKNIEQQRLILFAVARQGGRIVAAGRGQIKALKTGAKPAPYVIYFIGNPVGADVTIQAPPTVLQ